MGDGAQTGLAGAPRWLYGLVAPLLSLPSPKPVADPDLPCPRPPRPRSRLRRRDPSPSADEPPGVRPPAADPHDLAQPRRTPPPRTLTRPFEYSVAVCADPDVSVRERGRVADAGEVDGRSADDW